jgi:hypothetical protein
MKPFEYYSKPQISYPSEKDYTIYYVYDRGKCIATQPGYLTTKAELKKLFPNAVVQEVIDEDAYMANINQADEERNRLAVEFTEDLFKEFGVENNPKRFACFELAWSRGHAYGHSEVYKHFSDFVELIKD